MSFQALMSGVELRNDSEESQSPEGSACHFKDFQVKEAHLEKEGRNHPKALRVISREAGRQRESRFILSQSPEGSACHFKFATKIVLIIANMKVAITRRLCVSFQGFSRLWPWSPWRCCRNHPKALRVISRHGHSPTGANGCHVAITRRLCVSFQVVDPDSPQIVLDRLSRNHPKALRVISSQTVPGHGKSLCSKSQSPEGSACHFKSAPEVRNTSCGLQCRNHPKALRVISRYQCAARCDTRRDRRNHPKALRVISRYQCAHDAIHGGTVAITRRLCVSFQAFWPRYGQCARRRVAITRRLCVSFQAWRGDS